MAELASKRVNAGADVAAVTDAKTQATTLNALKEVVDQTVSKLQEDFADGRRQTEDLDAAIASMIDVLQNADRDFGFAPFIGRG